MSAIKKHLEDVIDYMAYQIVDYGMWSYEKDYTWNEIQGCVELYLWDNLYYVELYEHIVNNNRFFENEKNDLASSFFLGLAQQLSDNNIMELLEVC